MQSLVLTVGLICLVGAIVGGGIKLLGGELPALNSIPRQILLGLFGTVLIFWAANMTGVSAPEVKSTGQPPPDGGVSQVALQAPTLLFPYGYVSYRVLGGLPRDSGALKPSDDSQNPSFDAVPDELVLKATADKQVHERPFASSDSRVEKRGQCLKVVHGWRIRDEEPKDDRSGGWLPIILISCNRPLPPSDPISSATVASSGHAPKPGPTANWRPSASAQVPASPALAAVSPKLKSIVEAHRWMGEKDHACAVRLEIKAGQIVWFPQPEGGNAPSETYRIRKISDSYQINAVDDRGVSHYFEFRQNYFFQQIGAEGTGESFRPCL